ncbi:hypothetical protein OH76DRAFT_810998 [Lentinus brumalis]|uniref:F-box domain-containing protein n=1 Tax=Lentinus brumalis TaxID=2498619 RepID=A0A371D334_9APHY|nr:hypothetical protein OH76DRAFT_810998 [Polyporus brumalis]
MDKLAVELLTLISFFACTDGGRTGCSLALVSKRMNYASRPARFYSVTLINSATHIENFLACYQAERARAKDMIPRVRHLCVSLFGKGINTASAVQAQPKSRAEFLAWSQRRAQHWRSAQDNMDAQFNLVIPALMRAVAPDLRSLALMQAQWRSDMVVRCAFPCLEELTLVGGDPSFLPFEFVPSDRPLYPALKRLHHIFSLVNKDVDFLKWAQHAPNLTHLRVSRLDHHPRITVDSLEQVMSRRAPPDVFPHLRQVVIQPVPPAPAATDAPLLLSYRDFTARLRKSADKARVDVLLLPPMDMPKPAPGADPSRGCILKLQGVWMDRIEGGDGVWAKAIGGCGEHDGTKQCSPAVPARIATPLSASRWTNVGHSVL